MNYIGIDIHNDDSLVSVLDDDSEVVKEIRVQNANLDDVAEEYVGAKAAIEATDNYYTIYDTLDEHLNVVAADPSQIKKKTINCRESVSRLPIHANSHLNRPLAIPVLHDLL